MILEVFVRGTNAPVEVQESSLPTLYRELKGDRDFFLAVAPAHRSALATTIWQGGACFPA